MTCMVKCDVISLHIRDITGLGAASAQSSKQFINYQQGLLQRQVITLGIAHSKVVRLIKSLIKCILREIL